MVVVPKGSLSTMSTLDVNGDLLAVFKPVEEILSSSKSKIAIPINLFNRRGKRVSYAILELLVESKRVSPEWRLKLDNISITRQFKPAYSLTISNGEQGVHKFVYDITGILNAHEIRDKEWINVFIRYEGGNPFAVKYVLLDAIYDDQDAHTAYRHLTGLMLLESGEKFKLTTERFYGKSAFLRLITYTPKQAEIRITTNNYKSAIQAPQKHVEEYTLTLNESTEFVEIGLSSEKASPAIISSTTIYLSTVKEPLLELCNINYSLDNDKSKLKLLICNKGESSPDKLVISVMRKGDVLCSLQDFQVNIPPGGTIERVIEVPGRQLDEVNVRLVWFKLTRRWLKDELIRLK